MWRKYRFVIAMWAGIVAGIILGLFLKVIEHLYSLKVYTLLLNIDYIPILNRLQLPEMIEFILHLIISVLLSIALTIFIFKKSWSYKRRLFFFAAANVGVGLLLYPTTALSARTPDLFDIPALLVWLAGHLLYGLVLAMFIGPAKLDDSPSQPPPPPRV